MSNTSGSIQVTSPYSFTISGVNDVIINGNGTTFKQTRYNGGVCNTDGTSGPTANILQVVGSTGLTINDITVQGPGNCSGFQNEGDTAIEVGGTAAGNTNVTFNQVAIRTPDGDGFTIFPNFSGGGGGINKNIAYENGSITTVGYHGFVPEGVWGLNFTNNTINVAGNFEDAEVDLGSNSRDTYCSNCYNLDGTPRSAAQWDINVSGNTFLNDNSFVTSSQSNCVPERNWTFANNTFSNTASSSIFVAGYRTYTDTAGQTCDQLNPYENGDISTGLLVQNNTGGSANIGLCGGSIVSAPAPCAGNSVAGWTNVQVTGNRLLLWAGLTTYYPSTPWLVGFGYCDDGNVLVRDNTFNNAYLAAQSGFCFGTQSWEQLANSGTVTVCSNTYWITEPMYCDPNATGEPTPFCSGYVGSTPPPGPKIDAGC